MVGYVNTSRRETRVCDGIRFHADAFFPFFRGRGGGGEVGKGGGRGHENDEE